MISPTEIRSSIARYLAGDVDLRELNEQMVAVRYGAGREIAPEADALLGQVELRLAEYQHGDWSEAEMHELLRPLAWLYEVEISGSSGNGQPVTRLATDSQVVTAELSVV